MDKKQLTLGSLFDGSGGFPLGGILSGITPKWASEVEPYAIRVTTKRMPFVKHYGDISEMDGAAVEPVDIVTFGSPCQDMSVAGKRSGLDGSRSSLFYEAVRVIKEMRRTTNGKYPRYIVWENVPYAKMHIRHIMTTKQLCPPLQKKSAKQSVLQPFRCA
jgi:DNA (cytosine-5)-methyltransferase 1